MHWAEWGPRDAPVLVMLHGAYGSWPHFLRNIETFATNHRVLIPDLPGYGKSDMPGVASIAGIGQAVARDITELIGDASYRLFGFSFGGAVAGRLMLCHRARLSHVMLAAPAGIANASSPPMKGVRGKQGPELIKALGFNLRSIMFARDESITPQAIAIQHRVSLAARLRVERVDWGDGLAEPVTGFPGHLSVIWGTGDSFIKSAELPKRASIIRSWNPKALTHLIADTGHWAQYEASEQVNTLLGDLLAR